LLLSCQSGEAVGERVGNAKVHQVFTLAFCMAAITALLPLSISSI
jgi:hypothetical protein